MTQILSSDKQGLIFEILSARIYDEGEERKHVIYTLQVRHISGSDDLSPSVIERRYTHFLNLYNDLRKENPDHMSNVTFPKKVIFGNFDNGLISTRSTGFESLLKYISTNSKLRTSQALTRFLQTPELDNAKILLEEKNYSTALPYLENNFRLLNKVFTDRSPAVLIALCRLLGCCMSISGYPNADKWADLALHRYEGVSDNYLLELYVPLMQICMKIWQFGTNRDILETRLDNLKKQGVKMDSKFSFLEQVTIVEEKLFKL